MLDIGWSEMVVIAFIALMVMGPKELPRVLRSVAHWTRKARGLAREFQSGVDDIIREADLEDAKKALDSAKKLDLDKTIEDTLDPTGEVKDEVRSIEDSARDKAPFEAAEPSQDETVASGDEAAEPAEAADEDAPKATIIKHPLQVAPPHSITPPPAEEATPAPADQDPDKTPEKTA